MEGEHGLISLSNQRSIHDTVASVPQLNCLILSAPPVESGCRTEIVHARLGLCLFCISKMLESMHWPLILRLSYYENPQCTMC